MPRTIRLRTVLIILSLLVLALPVAGIQVLRLYESALVRQTESALIAQGVFVAALYRATFNGLDQASAPVRGVLLAEGAWRDHTRTWHPRPALLDLAESPILAPFPDGYLNLPADPAARKTGARVTPVLKDAQLETLAAIRVLDYQGVVVASTGGSTGENLSTGEEVRLALQGQYVSRLRRRLDVEPSPLSSISRSSGIRVFVCVPIVNDNRVLGAVLLSRTPTSILQALYGKRYLLAQAALVILAVVVAVALFASRMIARPLAGLARDAERIAQGEPNTLAEAPTPRTHEIAKLQASVIAMAQSLEQRAAYVSELSRHVSHEFKTPLTAIRGAVEVLRDHGGEMTEHERARFLENIGADADRLHRLTQRLLDLARADMASFATAPLDVGSLLTGIAAGERDTGLRIKLDVPAQPLLADSNEIVLTAALGCLLDNAAEHGATCVRMSAACAGHRIEVRVEDDGPGISAANRERVFQPFFTTARDRGGTGLGLTITAALLKRAGGDIALLDTCGGLQEHQLSGATFVVSLPAG